MTECVRWRHTPRIAGHAWNVNSVCLQPTWILLPGFDGTGLVFDRFLRATPAEINRVVVRYPCDRLCTAEELLSLVLEKIPASGSYVLIAESFSGPLALRAAVSHGHPPAAIVLCASLPASQRRSAQAWQRIDCPNSWFDIASSEMLQSGWSNSSARLSRPFPRACSASDSTRSVISTRVSRHPRWKYRCFT